LEQTARNRFRVVGQIGRGSIADVYLCRLQGAAGFEKDVALKRIHPDHGADPLLVRMFLEEARVVAKLTHANIAQVFEVGEDGAGPYIAMEYVRGVTLATIIARAHASGKIHHGHAARILAGVCDGLHCAHTAVDQDGSPLGIVHRDVKPTTIVVTVDGNPKLLDFGMASARGRLPHTQVAAFRRNLRYLAPEQIAQGTVDQRADVYGAGVTLYELTTGRHPFGTEADPEVQVHDRILNGRFPRPSEVLPGYPPELEAVVLAAMAADVGARLPSARELRDRLEAFFSSKEQASTPTGLAGWLRQLFPDFSSVVKVAHPTPAPRTTVARPAETQVTVPLRPPPPSRGGGTGWAVLGFLALALTVAIWLYQRRAPAPAVAKAVAHAPAPAPSRAVAAQQAAQAYLDAAEAFMREQRYPLAREALLKAAETTPAGSALERRLASVRERVETGLAAIAARPAPDLGLDEPPAETAGPKVKKSRPPRRRLTQNRARRRRDPPPAHRAPATSTRPPARDSKNSRAR
jgi:serine/threonine-protein kinase